MTSNDVRTTLCEVLQTIQAISGLECPPLEGALKPIEALPQFNSKIWPIAIGMLAAKLNIVIPDAINIFKTENTCSARTLDESVEAVMALITKDEQSAQLRAVGQ
mgnify:CR=1 FL=1